ncbi:MAG: hypothetical protein K0R09_1630, partial [Clostridiales bacterium]|nr:hypothetical protein [Clostridiales bacterium]
LNCKIKIHTTMSVSSKINIESIVKWNIDFPFTNIMLEG